MIFLFQAIKLQIPIIYQQAAMMTMMMILSSLISNSSLLLSFVDLLIPNLSSHNLIIGIMKGNKVGRSIEVTRLQLLLGLLSSVNI